ncbi:rhomboid family intramembrane serine protease [Azohydromonas aeria]|uniref:rhomboid family intramembrane serine protease n=1 Tax=Azohydromonas aeria TaxID=2590212 RepID=UPI0012F8EA56|nr:rhomboid family intramembrane serine protease [Azohydromonas aeria]
MTEAAAGARLSRARPWLALCALLAAGALLSFFLFPPSLLDGQPGRWLREPWRLWTAAWVHWTPLHLAANAAGVAALALYGHAADLERRHVLAGLAAWPLTHALLAAWGPAGMAHYGGLSGVLHAGVAVASTALLARAGLPRYVGAAVWAGLLLKLGLESPWSPWPAAAAGRDFSVATQAHAAGALAGALCALAVEVAWGKRARCPAA